MEQILEGLDLPEETKLKLTEAFDKAVEVKTADLSESFIAKEVALTESQSKVIDEKVEALLESKSKSYEKYVESQLDERSKSYEKYVESQLDEKAKLYEKYITSQLTESRLDIINTLDGYLDEAINEFMTENILVMEESVKLAKSEALAEGFKAMLIAGEISKDEILEAKAEKDVIDDVVNEAVQDRADRLMNENLKLKEENAELLRMGIMAETTKGMTDVMAEKFSELAEVIEFSTNDIEAYTSKIDKLAESLISTPSTLVVEKAGDVKDPIVESIKPVDASHLF